MAPIQERFEALPSGTFARGMVRSYARLLKLDAENLVGRMAARVAVPDNAKAVASVRRPIPITDSNRRTSSADTVNPCPCNSRANA